MQNSKYHLPVLFILLVGYLVAGCSSAPKVDWAFEIEAPGVQPLQVTYADLASKPQVDLKDILMQKTTGTDVVSSWRGVYLASLLSAAGAPAVYSILSVEASDGYVMEIPFSELENAIIALQEDGKWIAENDPDHGPIRLVAPAVPANRWVYAITKITVKP